MWEFVDKVVYINLRKRTDRNKHMKNMTSTFGNKVIRFEAIEDSLGYLGCARSHIGVLELAIQEKWQNVLVLEDDAEWNNLEENYKRLEKLSTLNYDVLLLGGVGVVKDTTDRVYSSQTATSYLVQSHYYQTLLANFKQAYQGLKQEGYGMFAIDQHWKLLQQIGKWYIVSNPCMVYQKPDYSDIENTYVDYRNAFLIV